MFAVKRQETTLLELWITLRIILTPIARSELASIMRFAFSITLFLLIVGCASECDIVNVRDYPSPDGKRVATIYGYDCHNTTGYAKYVHLHPAGTKMQHPGNVTVVGPGDVVAVAWTSPMELVVSYCYEVSRPAPASANIDGVKITFTEAPKLMGTRP
jgi:hypothetical protein